jgi:hypothetical protein
VLLIFLVFLFFCIVLYFFVLPVFVLCPLCPMLPMFLDCTFLIAHSVCSNLYSFKYGKKTQITGKQKRDLYISLAKNPAFDNPFCDSFTMDSILKIMWRQYVVYQLLARDTCTCMSLLVNFIKRKVHCSSYPSIHAFSVAVNSHYFIPTLISFISGPGWLNELGRWI